MNFDNPECAQLNVYIKINMYKFKLYRLFKIDKFKHDPLAQ